MIPPQFGRMASLLGRSPARTETPGRHPWQKGPKGRLWPTLGDWRRRWFPERQILLRGPDSVHGLRLAPAVQMAAAGTLMILSLWLATASLGWLVEHGQHQQVLADLDLTRAAYAELLDEITDQRERVAAVTADLEHHRSYLLAMIEQNTELRNDMTMISRQFESETAGKQAVADSQVRDQLRDLGRELTAVNERRSLLDDDLNGVRSRLAVGEAERRRFSSLRAGLDRKVRSLEDDLAQARTRIGELDRSLATQRTALDQAVSDSRQAVTLRDQADQRAGLAEQRLDSANLSHRQALAKLSEQTRNSIQQVERIVSATGLNPGLLLPVPATPERERGLPRGGPFVPWNGQTDMAAAIGPASANLSTDIDRLERLSRLLRQLPLGSPLAVLSISSGFGYRVDPFNNQSAFHEGIDFQGAFRTPVKATAPGTVSYAGWRPQYGRVIEIDHGNGIQTRYAHLDRVLVAEGAQIELQQEIGLLGATGRSSGAHLHYEVVVNGRPQNPLTFLKATSHAVAHP